jgi:3-hydroxymyristoyl/3-hydroxydecanoyl-(acyl carrier protein) dehydratase/acyl carrier protein
MSDAADVLEQIKTILRRDLKLGAAATIGDDMPLMGGEMDLDSLDVLLVVSSIEKHFGIKIPSEMVGREVFRNVGTLAEYVRTRGEGVGSATPQAAKKEIDWLAKLPHGPEFRFVSKVKEVVAGQRAVALWSVSGSEWFFAGHFPGRPIVPGVLLIEALAQVAGLACASEGRGGMLAHADVRFEAPIAPPVEIELVATVTKALGSMSMCDVVASARGKTAARGTVAIVVMSNE